MLSVSFVRSQHHDCCLTTVEPLRPLFFIALPGYSWQAGSSPPVCDLVMFGSTVLSPDSGNKKVLLPGKSRPHSRRGGGIQLAL